MRSLKVSKIIGDVNLEETGSSFELPVDGAVRVRVIGIPASGFLSEGRKEEGRERKIKA